MEKRRLSLNRSGGAKNYNSPLKGGPYSAHPVHYNMIENIHLDLDAMDNEIDKALNSTSTKVRQVTHNFTVLQSIYFNTDTGKWVLAQADDKDTIGTHVVVEVIDKDCFVAGLSGTFEVRNTLDLGYWFTSDTVAGELVDTAPDINNPMIQVIDSNSIRVLDVGIVDNLDSIPASNVIVTNPVTPDYTAPTLGDTMQDVTNKVAGLHELTYRKLYEIEITDPIAFIDITKDLQGNDLDLRVGFRVSYYLLADENALYISGIQINGITDEVYEFSSLGRNYLLCYGTRFGSSGGINLTLNGKNPDITFHYRGEYGTSQPGTIVGNAYSMRIRQNIESITSFRLLTDGFLAGSKIVIYGA